MKISKSVLSILAIAISSSAFASSYPEQIQEHKQKFQAELNSSTYDVVNSYAYQNIYAGLKGSRTIADPKNERTLILLNSNSNTVYTYKLYSEQESKTVQDLSEKLSKLGLSDGVIYTTIKAQLDESRKDLGYAAQFNNTVNFARRGLLGSLYFAPSEIQKFQEVDSSIRAQYADSAKAIIENNLSSVEKEINQQIYSTSQLFAYSKALHDRKGWASVIAYLYGQEINKKITTKEFNQVVASLQEYEKKKEISDFNSLPADAPLSNVSERKLNDDGLYERFVKHVWAAPDAEMLKHLQINSNMGEGAMKAASEFKLKQNVKAISEFNTLQGLALKESDPAVKSLIKQAADLKLASYAK